MSPEHTDSAVERARDLISEARRIVVLTGAGISAESGVPTFRGPSGLWKSLRPEQLATPEAFARDPRLVWEWYAWRRALVASCDPNTGHVALARLALELPARTTIVTQNVDGLHHRAARMVAGDSTSGAETAPDAAFPLEVHGAIHRDRCSRCDVRSEGVKDVDSSALETLPHCTACGGMLRPDVVWFGEALDPGVIGASLDAAGEADLCLVVGTSALVYPAASVPQVALQAGGILIEANLETTPLSPLAAVSLRGEAGKLLPALLG